MAHELVRRAELYIGARVDRALIDIISPSTEEVIRTTALAVPDDVDRAVDVARRTFDDSDWRWVPVAERITIIRKVADAVERTVEPTAQTPAMEYGSPIVTARFR